MEEDAHSDPEEFPIYVVGSSSQPICVEVELNGIATSMKVDTGAALSLLPDQVFHTNWPDTALRPSQVVLKTYTGETLSVRGEFDVRVKYRDQLLTLPLVVVGGSGPALLGRNWLLKLRLDWPSLGVAQVHQSPSTTLDTILHKYATVFEEPSEAIQPHQATLRLKPDTQPVFHRPRPVPYAIKGAVEEELDRLEAAGVLEKVTRSDWAAPIVTVPKKDGKYRICGDYKVTVNPALCVDQYPLPTPEDLFATLAGGKKFTKIDLTQAYLQLKLDENSAKYATINTHKGLYHCTRLPFGVASAPAVFQKTMDEILQGIPHAICYIDDILITGTTEEEHLATLEQVLQRLVEHRVKAKKSKCFFLTPSVEYLGHEIDSEGKHTLSDKLDAIVNAPIPTNLQELRSFLGLLNYYRKFLPNIATILQPLNALLQVNRRWEWSSDCDHAFQEAKKLLTSSRMLCHYDPKLPIRWRPMHLHTV